MQKDKNSFDFEKNILMRVKEGTPVYDEKNVEIGRVDDVFLGRAGLNRNQEPNLESGPDTTHAYPEGLDFQEDMFIPDPFSDEGAPGDRPVEQGKDIIRKRLMTEGYIHVETGLFSRDKIVLPDQIDSVSEDKITLNIPADKMFHDDVLQR